MTSSATTLMDEGKKSLDTLLRERAYAEVLEKLSQEGIDINDVTDEDLEALVAASVRDKMNGIKNFAMGGAFALLLSSMIGI